jgi:hypothetical protein
LLQYLGEMVIGYDGSAGTGRLLRNYLAVAVSNFILPGDGEPGPKA